MKTKKLSNVGRRVTTRTRIDDTPAGAAGSVKAEDREKVPGRTSVLMLTVGLDNGCTVRAAFYNFNR